MFWMCCRTYRDIGPAVLPLILADKTLKLARPIDFTAQAIVRMTCQQPFGICPAKFLQSPRIRRNYVTVFGQCDTGRYWPLLAFELHEAHTAYGVGRQTRVVTKCVNVDACFSGRIEQRPAVVQRDSPAIDC